MDELRRYTRKPSNSASNLMLVSSSVKSTGLLHQEFGQTEEEAKVLANQVSRTIATVTISELDASVTANNAAATELHKFAVNRLNKFYAPELQPWYTTEKLTRCGCLSTFSAA